MEIFRRFSFRHQEEGAGGGDGEAWAAPSQAVVEVHLAYQGASCPGVPEDPGQGVPAALGAFPQVEDPEVVGDHQVWEAPFGDAEGPSGGREAGRKEASGVHQEAGASTQVGEVSSPVGAAYRDHQDQEGDLGASQEVGVPFLGLPAAMGEEAYPYVGDNHTPSHGEAVRRAAGAAALAEAACSKGEAWGVMEEGLHQVGEASRSGALVVPQTRGDQEEGGRGEGEEPSSLGEVRSSPVAPPARAAAVACPGDGVGAGRTAGRGPRGEGGRRRTAGEACRPGTEGSAPPEDARRLCRGARLGREIREDVNTILWIYIFKLFSM